MSDPLSTIPVLVKVLRDYGNLSGYKVNENKSEAMMMIGSWPVQLNNIASFCQATDGFKCLGISITPGNDDLFKANYGKLFSQLKVAMELPSLSPLC